MYTFSKRLKITAISLIIIGALGWVSTYTSAHHLTLDDVKVMLEEEASHHGTSHNNEEAHASMIHSTH